MTHDDHAVRRRSRTEARPPTSRRRPAAPRPHRRTRLRPVRQGATTPRRSSVDDVQRWSRLVCLLDARADALPGRRSRRTAPRTRSTTQFRGELAARHGSDRSGRPGRGPGRHRSRSRTSALEQVVVEGTASGDLLAGPGHRRNTVLPGQVGTSAVFGRASTYGAPFARHRRAAARRPRSTSRPAQGSKRFIVIGVRRAGDPLPQPRPESAARLVLVERGGRAAPGSPRSPRAGSSTSTPRPRGVRHPRGPAPRGPRSGAGDGHGGGSGAAAADAVPGAAPGADPRGHRRPAAIRRPPWCGWSRPRS